MEELDDKINPMNHPDALVARFQFLRTAHGDGLDMNEPSYIERINAHLSSYSVENIKDIINYKDNQYLRDNLFVIPFLFARYRVIPNGEVKEYLRSVIQNYSESKNTYILYFLNNFENIINQKMLDTPEQPNEEDDRNTSIVLLMIMAAMLSAALYIILKAIGIL
jgi:hypothetical protein